MFKVGDKVMCIDNESTFSGFENQLVVGGIYTVTELSHNRFGWVEGHLKLQETRGSFLPRANRFIPACSLAVAMRGSKV